MIAMTWDSSLCVLSALVLWNCGVMLRGTRAQGQDDAKVVSQCYRSRGFSFVSLYCGYNKVIQIQRAFHGAHRNRAIDHCGQLDGDCITETTHQYDWSRCEGRHSCVQSITKLPSADCTESMVYLQVHYICVKGTAKTLPSESSTSSSTSTRKQTTPASPYGGAPESAMDICTNQTEYTSSVQVTNPGYPQYYTASTECRCIIKGLPETKVAVTYQDLALVMRGGQCVDWLLLQSLGFKNSAAVTCGQMSGTEKTLMAKGNWLLLHFHTAHMTAEEDEGGRGEVDYLGRVKKSMRGFKVRVTTKPEDTFEIQCHSTTPEVLSNLKYKDSGYDVNGNVIVPASDLNAIADSAQTCSMAMAEILLTVLLVAHVIL